MSTQEIEVKKSELLPKSTGSFFSFDEFDHFFDDFITRRCPRLMDWNVPTSSQANFPQVDIIDHENDIEVKAALPGVKKEDIDVFIINQTITIRASCKEEKKEEEKGKYFRREISQGEYQRTLSLPEYVNDEKAKAYFKDGLLSITIPKTEKAKRKAITIN